MAPLHYLGLAVFAALASLLYTPLKIQFTVMGAFRPISSVQNIRGFEDRLIADTTACEDMHYHEPSGLVFAACQGDIEKASAWMPGAGALEHPEQACHGHLVVIDPKTMKSQKLSVSNFEGPFSTHGFSLYNPPGDPKTVYIFAINHLPNPLWTAGSATEPKAASRVELFVHTVGSQTATHLRSISHPLIKTPNDLLALSENEFLVTNDHCAQEGVMRILEEVFHEFVSWTNLVHVRFDEQGNVDATISTDSIATNNGLGWGPNQQVLISDAFGGKIYFASQPDQVNRTVAISHHAQLESIVDNPSYFADPWAGLNGRDYSGYVLAGVARPLEFLAGYKDPTGKAPLSSMVWFLPSIAGRDKALAREKLAKLVFSDKGEDDFRGSTTALIVPIDPSSNAGKREGWLFVTGLITPAILATRIDFESALV